MNTPLILNIVVFILLLWLLAKTGKSTWSLAKKVFAGLGLGVLFGIALNAIYGSQSEVLATTLTWFNVVGQGYVKLLQMVVMPLVFISILSAVIKLHHASALGKMSVMSIAILLLTTFIAAFVGVMMTRLFGLSAEGLVQGSEESQRLSNLQTDYATKVSDLNVPDFILSFIPTNPFAELTGAHPTSIISVVIFATLLGIAGLSLIKENPQQGQWVVNTTESIQAWIMKLVRLVILLTPYGVFALISQVVASSNMIKMLNLAGFLLASYLGILIMFMVHGLLLALTGIQPLRFFKKVMPVLAFAFTSRSSAASIPLNIEAQTQRIGVPEAIASFSASFGTTIGQNGCAGLYPAMLAVMVAPTVGINPFDPLWILTLLCVVTLSSIGVAGVGGGATFAALIVLPMMGLPVTLVALLISIEPLIDMGRTALNVSGSMTAGTVTSQLLKQTNHDIFQQDDVDLKQS